MAYDGTIPALSNLISNDIPAMQENFSLLESAQVVDEGATVDGDYWRFENGLQICINNSLTVSDHLLISGSVYRSPLEIWTFPVNFINNNYVVSIDGQFNDEWGSGGTPTDNTSVKYVSFKTKSENFSKDRVKGLAIGRWK